jgi:hypothetical protein
VHAEGTANKSAIAGAMAALPFQIRESDEGNHAGSAMHCCHHVTASGRNCPGIAKVIPVKIKPTQDHHDADAVLSALHHCGGHVPGRDRKLSALECRGKA